AGLPSTRRSRSGSPPASRPIPKARRGSAAAPASARRFHQAKDATPRCMVALPVAQTGRTRAIFDRPSTPMLNAIGRICLALARHLKSGGVIVNEHVLDREQTRRHVDVLSRCFDFIHLNDLPRQLYRRGKKPFCLLTFDDGKRSNATAVAPELERLGVPAVFFVVSGSLDDQAPLWFDRHRALQKKLGATPNGLSLQVLKQLPYALLIERIERACSQYGIDANPRDA